MTLPKCWDEKPDCTQCGEDREKTETRETLVLQNRKAGHGLLLGIFLLTMLQRGAGTASGTAWGCAITTRYHLHPDLELRGTQLLPCVAFFIIKSWHIQMRNCGPILSKTVSTAAYGSRAPSKPRHAACIKYTPGSKELVSRMYWECKIPQYF